MGLSCFWEQWESPWALRERLEWVGAEGIPGILSPFLSSRSSQGTVEGELGLGGPDGASAPRSPHALAASPLRMCRRSQEPSGELGECKRYFASLISRGG